VALTRTPDFFLQLIRIPVVLSLTMSHPADPGAPRPDEETSDPVWALLDRARRVTPSPGFSHRVLNTVRSGRPERPHPWSWLRAAFSPAPRLAFAAAALALLAAGIWALRSREPHNQSLVHQAGPAPTAAESADQESEHLIQTLAAEFALLEDADHLLAPEDGLDLEMEDVGLLLF